MRASHLFRCFLLAAASVLVGGVPFAAGQMVGGTISGEVVDAGRGGCAARRGADS